MYTDGRTRARTGVPPDPRGSCVGGCDPANISKVGTNATYIRETCLVCGHIKRYPRASTKKYMPADCPHERTDNRNSSRSVHRTFCLDCETVICEVPQSEHRLSEDVAKEVARAPVRIREVVARIVDENTSIMTKEHAVQAAAVFAQLFQRFVARLPDTAGVERADMIRQLNDAIDVTAPQLPPVSTAESSIASSR